MNRMSQRSAGALAGLCLSVLVSSPLSHAETTSTAAGSSAAHNVAPKLGAAILAAPPGGIVDVGDLHLPDLPRVAWQRVSAGGPPFILSDAPEYFRVPEGAGVREPLDPGRARLYLYHVNGTTDTATKKITAVIENLSDEPMQLRMVHRALPRPSANYYRVGKRGLVSFLESLERKETTAPVRTIAAKSAAVLDEELDAFRPEYNELVHGWYEFEIDRRARLTVLQTRPETPSVEANRRIESPLPSAKRGAGAGRGMFPVSSYTITNAPDEVLDSARGPVQLVVADGRKDPWVTGFDDSQSTVAVNKGNYGVIYRIRLRRTSSDGRGLALLMYNLQTGALWCDNMAAAVGVSPGVHPGGVVPIPSTRLHITGLDQAAVAQVFPPLPKGQEDTIEILYSPPGASCLPTPLVFIPVEMEGSGG